MRRRPRSAEAPPGHELPPEAELEVLAALEALEEATVAEVRARLRPFRPMSHASASTLLGRLEARGLVERRKGEVGKAYVYRPARDPEPALGRAAHRVLDRLFAGDSARLVAALFDRHDAGLDELERLKRLVDELYNEKRTERA